jgi:hypothetical protein
MGKIKSKLRMLAEKKEFVANKLSWKYNRNYMRKEIHEGAGQK